MSVTLVQEEVVQWALKTPPVEAHALICDPPYELNFMGRDWDRSGVAFRPETWHALAQHLHPGAFGLCFASARGWHRLACALEDAGMVLHPSVFMLGWMQGSGWPKATRVGIQIDKQAGATRERIGRKDELGVIHAAGDANYTQHEGYKRPWRDNPDADAHFVTRPATPLAATWEQYCYGRQALKPTLEPIIVWQKPYTGAPVDSITTTGAGALWIDGCRISGPLPHHNYGRASGPESMGGPSGVPFNTPSAGRWPPNTVLVHAEHCRPSTPRPVRTQWGQATVRTTSDAGYSGGLNKRDQFVGYANADGIEIVQTWDCAPGCSVAALDAQAGDHKAGGAKDCREQEHGYMGSRNSTRHQIYESYGDSGPVSRFYPQFGWADDIAERLALADPAHYCPKASQAERSAGLPSRNRHPTIKPLALCAWLATLLLPPAAYAPRRLLVPFAGTGSEMIGGVRVGWEEVLGIEQDPASLSSADRRIAYWTGWQPAREASVPVQDAPPRASATQLQLW